MTAWEWLQGWSSTWTADKNGCEQELRESLRCRKRPPVTVMLHLQRLHLVTDEHQFEAISRGGSPLLAVKR